MKPFPKTIRLPDLEWARRNVPYAQEQLERAIQSEELARKDRNHYVITTAAEARDHLARCKFTLRYAEFCHRYVSEHDCAPIIKESRKDDWGRRSAIVSVEGVEYRVIVSPGKMVRIAFKPRGQNRGFRWNLDVIEKNSGRRIKSKEVPKSEGLGAAAVRAHIESKFDEMEQNRKRMLADVRFNLRGGGFTGEEIDALIEAEPDPRKLIGKKSERFIASIAAQ